MSDPVPPEPQAASEFSRIFAEESPFVWRVLQRHGVRYADLEDACQEVFVVVHRRLSEFEGHSTLRTWLYGIALRVAKAFRVKAHVRREVLSPEAPEGVENERAEEHTARGELMRQVAEALDAMSPEKREVFALYEIDGLTMAEIAAALDCALGTAFSRLYAARSEVRAHLQRARTIEAARAHAAVREQGGAR